MPIPPIVFYGVNVGEFDNSLILSPGAAADRPIENLFDRDIEVPWQDVSASGNRIFDFDQGGSPSQIVSAVILDGHNQAGATLTVQSADSYGSWVTRYSALIASGTRAVATFAGVLARYWRVYLSSCPFVPVATELWLTNAVTFTDGVQINTSAVGDQPVGVRFISDAGHYWANARNDNLWKASYTLPFLSQAERDTFLTFYRTIFGVYPFYVQDHEGTVRFVALLLQEASFEDEFAEGATEWHLTVELAEVR